MRPPQDMARELLKVHDAVAWVADALDHQARHDAAMHMNATIRHNPATTALMQAKDDLQRLIQECEETP